MIQTEMNAYEGQINLKLLGSIVSFTAQAANATQAQKNEIRRRRIFSNYPADPNAMQEEYGFLYLGELLERYEDRFGMTPQDRRAIALALGYAAGIATDGMFVGSQRADFIQSVRRSAPGDIYLIGALYLLHEGQSDGPTYENQLKEWKYDKTEELLFAMSLFSDAEQALAFFKPQFPHLLGKGRTLPVLGNMSIFQRMMAMLFPLKKQLKAKNMAVVRALLALPASFVREGSKPHGYLLECGYTPLEITYANVMAVESQCVPGSLYRGSLTMEKIIVSLFRTVLSYEEALPAAVYDQLSGLYSAYSRFEIKYCGVHRLGDALKDNGRIRAPETMAWFIERESIYHPAVDSFDIVEKKWDSLAAKLKPDLYQELFDQSLNGSMDTEELRRRIDRYNELTQRSYLDCYSTHPGKCFSLLVRTGIIDLWTAFQNSAAPDGTVTSPIMRSQIEDYISGIQTPQAFRFFEQFLPQYGFDGFSRYLDPYRRGFSGRLWGRKDGRSAEISLTISRDFLKDDANKLTLLLHWAEEYFFTQEPERYLFFVSALLENKEAAALLPQEDLRGLYELVIGQKELSGYTVENLKRLYQTPEERQTEQDAKEAAQAEKKRQEYLDLVQSIETDYAEDTRDGTIQSVQKFLGHYRFYGEQAEIAARVAHKGLEPLLQCKDYLLSRSEADCFLRICGNLVGLGVMDWAEIQSCILKIKEAVPNAPDCNSAA